MEKEKVIALLEDYAKRNNEVCKFEEVEGGELVSKYSYAIANGILDDFRINHKIVIHPDNSIVSMSDILLDTPEERYDAMREFIIILNGACQEAEYCFLEYSGDVSVSYSVSFEGETEEFFDDEKINEIFNYPYYLLEQCSQGLVDMLQGNCTPKEAAEPLFAEDDAEDEPATLEDIRYFFEHGLLHQAYFDNKLDFIHEIKSGKGKYLYGIFKEVCLENDVKARYKEKDFKVEEIQSEKGYEILRIVMPEPECESLCYEINMMYQSQTDKYLYFILEKGENFKDRYLNSMDALGRQYKHGVYGKDRNAVVKAMDTFWERKSELV